MRAITEYLNFQTGFCCVGFNIQAGLEFSISITMIYTADPHWRIECDIDFIFFTHPFWTWGYLQADLFIWVMSAQHEAAHTMPMECGSCWNGKTLEKSRNWLGCLQKSLHTGIKIPHSSVVTADEGGGRQGEVICYALCCIILCWTRQEGETEWQAQEETQASSLYGIEKFILAELKSWKAQHILIKKFLGVNHLVLFSLHL